MPSPRISLTYKRHFDFRLKDIPKFFHYFAENGQIFSLQFVADETSWIHVYENACEACENLDKNFEWPEGSRLPR